MKKLNYYTETKTKYRNINYFYNILEDELSSFVGTIKELENKKKEINEKAKKMFFDNQNKKRQEENDLIDEFKNDLAKENGIENNPKLEILWNKAWDYGHSCGLHEVKYHFENLIELID